LFWEGVLVENSQGHANKNTAGQATSWIRTVHFGRFWVDYSMARQFGLPPAILAREAPMSDKAQAIFSNPFYLVTEAVSR